MSIKFDVGGLHLSLPGEFNFGPYVSNAIPTLHEAPIQLYRFFQKWLFKKNCVHINIIQIYNYCPKHSYIHLYLRICKEKMYDSVQCLSLM
jgi:hypothetical protein